MVTPKMIELNRCLLAVDLLADRGFITTNEWFTIRRDIQVKAQELLASITSDSLREWAGGS